MRSASNCNLFAAGFCPDIVKMKTINTEEKGQKDLLRKEVLHRAFGAYDDRRSPEGTGSFSSLPVLSGRFLRLFGQGACTLQPTQFFYEKLQNLGSSC